MSKRERFTNALLAILVIGSTLILGAKAAYRHAQAIADRFWSSLTGTGIAIIVFVLITAACYDRATAINGNTRLYEWLTFAALAVTCVIICLFVSTLHKVEHQRKLARKH